MSVAEDTSPKRTKERSIKSWTNITKEQKQALDELASDNHMSTSEYHRVVLSFAIANRWGFPPAKSEHYNDEEFQRLIASHPSYVPRKYAFTKASIANAEHIGMGPVPK